MLQQGHVFVLDIMVNVDKCVDAICDGTKLIYLHKFFPFAAVYEL